MSARIQFCPYMDMESATCNGRPTDNRAAVKASASLLYNNRVQVVDLVGRVSCGRGSVDRIDEGDNPIC